MKINWFAILLIVGVVGGAMLDTYRGKGDWGLLIAFVWLIGGVIYVLLEGRKNS